MREALRRAGLEVGVVVVGEVGVGVVVETVVAKATTHRRYVWTLSVRSCRVFLRSEPLRTVLTCAQNDFVTGTTVAIEAKKTATADMRYVEAEHPVRRQIIWRKNRETDLARHPSYGIAVEMQARGNLNATPCNSCARGAGPFETGCVSFSTGYGPENKVPFGGACANCFWGGQGGRCTLRVGGGKFPSLPFSSFPSLYFPVSY